MLRCIYYVDHLHTKLHKNNFSSLNVIAINVKVHGSPEIKILFRKSLK